MVMIEIHGANKKKAALAQEAALFTFNYLMPRLRKQVDVEIIFTDIDGACGYQAEIGEREFEIELDKGLTGDDLLTAIFHEVTHCVQDLRGTKTGWELPYYERPFEIEAYAMQEEILKKWQKEVDF